MVYTRRTRLLDEELDETKDIITSPCNLTAQTERPLAFAGNPVHGGDNKTDFEKCREGKPDDATLRKDLLSGSNMCISTTTNDRSPQLAPVMPTFKHQLRQLDKTGHMSDTTPSNRTANKSGTQSSSVSTSEPDIQESAILRRQQLNRVAEWVQNNHLDGVQVDGERKSDGDSVASLDSGYKTKVNNNLSQCDEDVGESPTQPQKVRVSSTCDDNKLSPNDFAQNLSNNNHLISSRNGQRLLTSDSSGACSTDTKADVSTAAPPTQIDFAQMEYNVKQFLLKQNEWSIKGPPHEQLPLPHRDTSANPHRTETNL